MLLIKEREGNEGNYLDSHTARSSIEGELMNGTMRLLWRSQFIKCVYISVKCDHASELKARESSFHVQHDTNTVFSHYLTYALTSPQKEN